MSQPSSRAAYAIRERVGRLETISEALDTEKAAHAATSKAKSKLESDLNSERKAHISTKKKLSQLEVKD
ncbi:hypothetical protein Q8W17_02500 [Photobacterium damselae subsp. piscicida]|nr:hypothetical protein [Photobacterium damselae subsp. piscicida]